MSDKKIIALARAAALKQLNEDRAERGYPPLTKLERLWWEIYGGEWVTKIQMEQASDLNVPKDGDRYKMGTYRDSRGVAHTVSYKKGD